MSHHLEAERLAQLVEESPTGEERMHLESCDRCRSELEGLRVQTRVLRELPDLDAPAREWALVSERLSGEGLMSKPRHRRRGAGAGMGPDLEAATESPVPGRRDRAPGRPPVWRAAAGLALFLLGALAGAGLRGATDPAGMAGAEGPPAVAAMGTESAEEAARLLQAAEAAYLSAVAGWLAQAEPEDVPDPLARLAALETIVHTTRAALDQAPADPLINGYHLTALAQRDAMLEQLANLTGSWF